MYKLGYLDDDQGNRTSFARQFEKDFDLCMVEDLNKVPTLQSLLEMVETKGLDALAIDFQLAGSGILSYNGDEVVEYFDKNKKYFPVFMVTSYVSDALQSMYDVYLINDKEKVENDEYRGQLIVNVQNSIIAYQRRVSAIENKVKSLEKKQSSIDGLTSDEEKELLNLHLKLNAIDPKANPVSAEQLQTKPLKELQELVKNSREILKSLS
ncbi:hypothetical protein [Leyella stercorea]|uniref:hypothetical protein n=1 Tax=Leyella stercorea TaxID=363265 RepID=UPI00242E61FC|nr:hypothetical protein [Leyella stercorea]